MTNLNEPPVEDLKTQIAAQIFEYIVSLLRKNWKNLGATQEELIEVVVKILLKVQVEIFASTASQFIGRNESIPDEEKFEIIKKFCIKIIKEFIPFLLDESDFNFKRGNFRKVIN